MQNTRKIGRYLMITAAILLGIVSFGLSAKSASAKGVGNGQCVAYARYASGINYYGNAITWKRHINSHAPVKGAVVVLNYGKYGHLAVVTAVGANTITVSEQNYKGKYVISSRVLSKHDPKILGYVAKKTQVA